jgi:hypothetical protein
MDAHAYGSRPHDPKQHAHNHQKAVSEYRYLICRPTLLGLACDKEWDVLSEAIG